MGQDAWGLGVWSPAANLCPLPWTLSPPTKPRAALLCSSWAPPPFYASAARAARLCVLGTPTPNSFYSIQGSEIHNSGASNCHSEMR